jgi:glycosyltransferase involved in cell wall biosynthesis
MKARRAAESLGNKRPVLLNGSFLAKPVTGVQRFGRQLIEELFNSDYAGNLCVAVPAMLPPKDPLVVLAETRGVSVYRAPRWLGSHQAFEQIFVPFAARKVRAVSLLHVSNVVALFVRRSQVVLIYDAAPMRHPSTYRMLFRAKFGAVMWSARRASVSVVTISDFSKRELEECGLPITAIVREGCGSSQQAEILTGLANGRQPTALPYGLTPESYAIILGSTDARKRVGDVVHAWQPVRKQTGLDLLVIGGDTSTHKGGLSPNLNQLPPGIYFHEGRLSESELVACLSQSAFAVFASEYEGGALAAEEALALGVRCVVSEIPTFLEILGSRVCYFRSWGDLGRACGEAQGSPRPKTLSAGQIQLDWQRAALELAAIIWNSTDFS